MDFAVLTRVNVLNFLVGLATLGLTTLEIATAAASVRLPQPSVPLSSVAPPIASTRLTTRLHFCGEMVPTEQSAVSQKLALALISNSGYTRHVEAIKRRSASYFAVISPILRKYRIPEDFRYLPLIESDWKANAVSSAGAVGYWQFMDETARDMGLRITPENDEREDLVKSTEAACRYLNTLYRSLGSWTLVAAAYNGGIGMLQRKMIRQGHRDYYRLALNEETGYYLYRILAMKELFTNAAYYARLALGPMAYYDNPYEREREQARRMGWLNDRDLDPVGEPLEMVAPAPGSEASLMDSLLVRLLADKSAVMPVFTGDVVARLTKAGLPKPGQSWAFVVTQSGQAGEYTLKAGDVLYAVVDEVDAKGVIYLRATKALLAATKESVALTLTAMNPATGQAGILLPKGVKTGWVVQFFQ